MTSDNKSDIIPTMDKILYIMRGPCSSGKSFLSNQLKGETGQVFSADDFHTDQETGEYKWKPQNVKRAHQWNHSRVKSAIEQGVSPIIIDNTHIKKWELVALKPLVQQAKSSGYDIKIEEPNPNWYHWDTAFDPKALYERNKQTHKVPYEAIKRMVDNYEKNITVDDILAD